MNISEYISTCEETLKICDSVESYKNTFQEDSYIQNSSNHDITMMRLGYITAQIKADIEFLEQIEKEMKMLEKQNSIFSEYLSEDELSEAEEKLQENE